MTSKKSTMDLAPSSKRLKLDESGATLDSQIGVRREETGGQRIPAETPAQKVLRLPELVSMIFGHLAADTDLQSLKNARVVCSLWKHEVFVTLRNNLSLMPCIVVENPNGGDAPVSEFLEDSGPHKSLQSAVDSLMPGCGFPLKLAVNEWTPALETFMRDFSNEIVSFRICDDGNESFHGFPAELGSIELPALRHCGFKAQGIGMEEGKFVEFVKAVTFWNAIVKVSKNLKTSEVVIQLRDLNRLRPERFDQVDWSQVGDLRCSYEFFSELCASNELSKLHDLECHLFQDDNDAEDLGAQLERISLKKTPNLSTVTLCHQAEWILDHPMRRLAFLWLEGTAITGTQSPSKLIPNLEEILIDEASTEARSFDCLTSDGGVFKKAVDLTLFESWRDMNERIGYRAGRLCTSFPNLKNLEWESRNNENEDMDNNNALYAAPVIFSRLEFLTSLKLLVVLPSEREVVELLTGISLENIPEEENSWPAALVDNPRSITNLKNLEKFGFVIQAEPITVDSQHTRFLFAAAFRTMQTLEELWFEFINFEDTSCATEWEQIGRKIKVLLDDQGALDSSSDDDAVTTDSESSDDSDE